MAPADTPHLHVALARAWEQARASGTYAIPAGPGGAPAPFIHLCFPDQLSGVLERHFAAEPEPLVLLELDPADLDIRLEPAPDGSEIFPHLYGALPAAAVRAVHADPRPGGPTR